MYVNLMCLDICCELELCGNASHVDESMGL